MSSVSERVNGVFGERFGELNDYQLVALVVAFGALVLAPLWGGSLLRMLALANIFAIFAMSWDIQSGYTGYISFGHAVLSGSAAYTSALLLTHVGGFSMLLTFPLAVLATLIVGLLLAVPTLRLKGPYFSLVTLAAGLLFYRAAIAFSGYTGGEQGLLVGRFTFDPVLRFYITLIPMLVIAVGLLYISRSNVGAILVAIRENERAVEAAGIDTAKFKLWSFVLSAIPMGVAGFLFAGFDGTVNPVDMLLVDRSIEIIAMAVIGGMSSILGPIGGAFLFVGLRDSVLPAFLSGTERWIALWLFVLLVFVFARDGLFRRLWHRLGELGGEN